jgi:O-antigen/teichoic acid export membrane protein
VNLRFVQVVIGRFFATGVSLVTGLILLKVLDKYTSKESLGVITVSLRVLAYLPLLDGGFRLILNRELLASTHTDREHLLLFGQTMANRTTVLAMMAGPIITLLYSFSYSASAAGLPTLYYFSIGVAGALTFASTMQVLTLVGLDRQGWMSVIQGAGSITNLVILWTSLHQGLGIWAFPLGQSVAALGMWSAAAYFIRSIARKTPVLAWEWTSTCRLLWLRYRSGAWTGFRMQLFTVFLLSFDLILAGFVTHDTSVLTSYGLIATVLGIGQRLLVSLGEASWPRIARGDTDPIELTRRVLAANAWLYGASSGLLLGAVPAVLAWYVPRTWTPAPLLHSLLVLRFLVIGLTSPASFSLIGAGDYRTMMRCVGRELAIGTFGGLLFGWTYGAAGVAGAFLAATFAGTAYPIFAAYARQHQLGAGRFLLSLWVRSLLAALCSGGISYGLVRAGWGGIWTMAAALIGGLAAMTVGIGVGSWRTRGSPHSSLPVRIWGGL